MAKHLGGIPKQMRQEPYKPSVYCETLTDPKMDIPQNDELFDHVIKYANTQAANDAGKPKKKNEFKRDSVE